MLNKKLKDIFSRNRIDLGEEEIEKFTVYIRLLKKWNRVHALTAVKREEDIIVKHFVDSLSLVECFEELGVSWRGKTLVDVGSGAGFPGVPLKIYLKDFELTLIESVAKKCSFLEYLKVSLGLEYRVLCERAEKVKDRFNVVVTRALGSLEKITPVLERLSEDYVFILKGREIEESWLKELGYNLHEVKLPDLKGRYILWKRL